MVSCVADGSGITLRTVIAETFDLSPDGVERILRRGDQVAKLNRFADAIAKSPEVDKRDTYGRIVFRYAAYRYHRVGDDANGDVD